MRIAVAVLGFLMMGFGALIGVVAWAGTTVDDNSGNDWNCYVTDRTSGQTNCTFEGDSPQKATLEVGQGQDGVIVGAALFIAGAVFVGGAVAGASHGERRPAAPAYGVPAGPMPTSPAAWPSGPALRNPSQP